MGLDLSALDSFEEPATANGEPLEIDIKDIMEDPDQPRVEFDDISLRELSESIKERNVKSPISVRTNKNDGPKWIINHGARRYRASVMAGKASIPAFIDEDYLDFDQVIENLQRNDLTPLELAKFIERKIKEGFKKRDIAQQLSVSSEFISLHQTLIEPSDLILNVYNSGLCRTIKTLTNLRKLYEKYPSDVESWVASEPDITRSSVSKLEKSLKEGISDKELDKNLRDESTKEDRKIILDPTEAENCELGEYQELDDTLGDGQGKKHQHSEANSDSSKYSVGQSSRSKKDKDGVLVEVEFCGDTYFLDLLCNPSNYGSVVICNDNESFEVSASDCKLLGLARHSE